MANEMQASVEGLTFFEPVLAFLTIFVIMFAVLMKTSLLGEQRFIQLLISFVTATVFVLMENTRDLVLSVIPWFAVLLIALFFILMLIGFIGWSDFSTTNAGKGLGWFFVILMFFSFLISGIKVFSSSLIPYLPGPYYGHGGNPEALYFFDWFYSANVIGAFWLVLIGGIVTWILVKGEKKKDR
jgi:hypothetical protein